MSTPILEEMSLKYKIRGAGCSALRLRIGQQACTMRPSYIWSDPLPDLIRAAGQLLDGAKKARLSINEEPQEFRWLLSRSAGDGLRVKILAFDDLNEQLPDRLGREVLTTACSLTAFCRALAEVSGDTLSQYGLKGYEREWWLPFPIGDYLRLCKRLKVKPVQGWERER